jgi:hypothetical protein
MVLTEKIQRSVQKLPTPLQAEVLDFVEYLVTKTKHQEESAWSDLSLAFAMRGIEDEETPIYTTADLKVVFT